MSSKNLNVQIYSLSPQLGAAIGQCRQTLNMSVHEFAKKIHKTPDFVFQLERAEIRITSQVLLDSATALDLSIGELIDVAVSGGVLLLTDEDEFGSTAQEFRCLNIQV
jgi:transcriptional regulator with XRE-family HTH domain